MWLKVDSYWPHGILKKRKNFVTFTLQRTKRWNVSKDVNKVSSNLVCVLYVNFL